MSNGGYGADTYGGAGGAVASESGRGIVGRDQIVIEDLNVNDLTNWFILEDPGFQFTPAKKKLNQVGSSLSDGSAFAGDETRYENAEMVFTVARMNMGRTDEGLDALSQLTEKLNKARDTQGGLPVLWTPVGSSVPLTWYMLEGELEEIRTGRLDAYPNAPTVGVHLYLRPFGYAGEQSLPIGLADPFLYNSLLNGQWRIDQGVGTLIVAFGVLGNTAVGSKRVYRSATVTDHTQTMRFKWGATLTGSSISLIAKRLDANNRLAVDVRASGTLAIRKVVGGASTDLATTTAWSEAPVAGRYYWVQANWSGDDVLLALYADNQNPLITASPTPIATLAYTLTGGDSTQFGADVRGNPGIALTTAASDTTMNVTDWGLHGAPDIKSSDPLADFLISDVPGHVPAEGRITVKEGSAQARAHFEWGLECKNFDETAMWPLLIDSDALDTTGFAGNPSGSGQYDPDASGNSAITTTQISETVPLTVCGTGNQSHIGPFKVKVHVKGDPGVRVRLAYRQGGGPLRRNNYGPALSGVDWQEIDLGMINIAEAPVGTQRWEGRFEAVGVAGGQLILDYVLIIPLERYGVARAPLSPIIPTTYTALDHFNQGASAMDNALLAVAPADLKWHVSSPPAGPLSIDTVGHRASRALMADVDLNSGSYARVGTTNFGSVQVQADLWIANRLLDNRSYHDEIRWGLLLSYQNASNWVMAIRQLRSVATPKNGLAGDADYDHQTVLRVYKRVGGGTPVQLGFNYEKISPNQVRTVIASMDSAGVWQVYSFPVGTKQPAKPILSGQDPDLAGALQNGLFGIYDACTTTPNVPANMSLRCIDNFAAFAVTPDSVIGANRMLEVRPETALKEVPGALGSNFYGTVPMYRSSRGLYIPVAGDEGRISRVAVKLRRTDVDGGLPDGTPTSDAATYAAYMTPRYLHPPGSE